VRSRSRHIITLLIALACGFSPFSTARAQMKVVRDTPPAEYRVLSGDDWLAGHGVDVYYYSSPDHPTVLTRDGTYMYECVELAISLYGMLGYHTWKVNGNMIQSAAQMITATLTHPQGLEDLEYYPNGDFIAPRSGDIVVWDSDYNGGTGHVGIVNRIAGNDVEVIQQNMWQGSSQHYRIMLTLTRDESLRYTLTARDESSPAGWIRSPRMFQYLAQPTRKSLLNTFRSEWNRDGETLFVYLSPRLTRLLVDEKAFDLAYGEESGDKPFLQLSHALELSGALSLTDPDYAQRMLYFAMQRMRSDRRLSSAAGVRSIDVMLKYTGDSVWLRPWGGAANGTWLRYDGLQKYAAGEPGK
jgi:hypothetical protein